MTRAEMLRVLERSAAGEGLRQIAASIGYTYKALHQAVRRHLEREAKAARQQRVREAEAASEAARLRESVAARLASRAEDARRRRIESQVMLGVPRRSAEIEAMRWHERRRRA